jgi:prevent-host-death family protein
MKRFTATDAKNKFGEILDASMTEPVMIEKNGRPVAVLISKAEYDRLSPQESRRQLVRAFHEESMERYASVYAALAK